MIVLFQLACVGPRTIEDADDFYRAIAEVACDQVLECAPESWWSIEGREACETAQLERVETFFGAPRRLTADDLEDARRCVDEIADQSCDEQVDGSFPGTCWGLRRWRDDTPTPVDG